MYTTTPVGFEPTRGDPIGLAGRRLNRSAKVSSGSVKHFKKNPLPYSSSISGLVVEYIVAIDVTRVRFPADAFS